MAARELSTSTLEALMRTARRSAIPHEAEDLVQEVLLCAIEKERDCTDPSFLPWATGALRNGARFAARTAGRRRRREHAYALEQPSARPSPPPRFPDAFIATLRPSRRVVALLIHLGMGRHEIAYLLGLSEVALRQRIAGVRKALAGFAGETETETAPPSSFPPNGLARRALKASLPSRPHRRLGIRDPDGMPIFFAAGDHVSGDDGNPSAGPTSKGPPENAD